MELKTPEEWEKSEQEKGVLYRVYPWLFDKRKKENKERLKKKITKKEFIRNYTVC